MSTKTRQPSAAAQFLANARASLAVAIKGKVKAGNTKLPIAQDDKDTIRKELKAHHPDWLGVFYELGISTGHRTNDLASLTWDCISFEEHSLTVVVSKQTKSAQSRAYNRGFKEIRANRQAEAMAAGDAGAFMRWANADHDQLLASASNDERYRLNQLIASVEPKIDRKRLSPELVARLAAMKEKAFWGDQWVFSRALTLSNSTRLESGHHITRQTVWARFKAVFAAVAELVENSQKLSAYSLRKTYAFSIYLLTGRLAAVTQALGHAGEKVTLRYLGLDNEAEKAQIELVGGTA